MTTMTYAKGGIPLCNLSSASTVSYSKPYNHSIETASTLAPSTIASSTRPLSAPLPPFLPTSSLQIQAQGKPLFNLPSPLKELSIPIFSITTGRPVYISVRAKRSSGSCILIDAESETETVLSSTEYFWGPNKDAIVRVGEGITAGGEEGREAGVDEFEIQGMGFKMSRSVKFECRYGIFEWRYAGKRERAPGVNSLLVLEKIIEGENAGRVQVAQLVRGEETRTPGTGSSTAGNGGRLEMCLQVDGEGKEILDEVTVVSTALVMLKREVDRRRALQIAMISAAVGGAGG